MSKPPRPLQMTRTYSRTNSIVPGPLRHLLATLFSSKPLQTIIAITQTLHGPLKASKRLPDWLSLLQDHHLCSRSTQTNLGYSMPFAVTPDYHYHHPSLQNYLGPVKASQSTAENQDLLHDHQHFSKPTTTFPGHSKLIPTTPDHQCHHPSLQNYHGSVKVSQTTPNNQDLLYRTTSTVPNQPQPFLVTPYLSQPVQITNAITRHSIPTMDHSKLHRAFLID
jgi:pterin-4a-carbinolamine dehydratase